MSGLVCLCVFKCRFYLPIRRPYGFNLDILNCSESVNPTRWDKTCTRRAPSPELIGSGNFIYMSGSVHHFVCFL